MNEVEPDGPKVDDAINVISVREIAGEGPSSNPGLNVDCWLGSKKTSRSFR
jgi:hypothetical protein